MMVTIKLSEPRLAYEVSKGIPEFEPPYPWSKWEQRLEKRTCLCFVAYSNGKPIGCKVGYFADDHFYSWVGGVLPAYRQKGVARKLASEMEKCLRDKGIRVIRMKTQQRFNAMLEFALGNGFQIVDEEKGRSINQSTKIVLEKKL